MDSFRELQIRTAVEYEAKATRTAYESVVGDANSCECELCENYRRVRELIYPKEFRDLLETLGIDYRKEIELTHLAEPDAPPGVVHGHACTGHYSFIGRIVQAGGETPETFADFCYAVTSTGGPFSLDVFRRSPGFVDLCFFVPEVPKA